ncbi:hypothetical protein M3661_19305 [Paenibacillus sp. MER 180]|uniref:hypothetical protein n=1 Tax=unclassified Paenibacillus TaxID=185978 RepID=UPI0020424540|nr:MULTISPECIES: hypothetical protein [unclassified Paenibacillus]MCM3292272.1 hypothetical protein [Paenibacillus sp. MER 180]
MQTHVGFIVGSVIASVVLIAGIIGLVLSKRRGDTSTWAGWAVLFGVCALASAVINLGIAK